MEVYRNISKIKDLSGHNGAIYSMVFDKQSQSLYSTGGDGWIVRWNPFSDNPDGILIANTTSKIFSLHLVTQTGILAAGDMDGHIYWIDTVQSQILKRSAHHKGSVLDIWSEDDMMYTVGSDGYLVKWHAKEMVPEISSRLSAQGLRCICSQADTDLLFIGASDNNIYIVDKQTFSLIYTIKNAHGNSVFSLAILDANTLISGGRDAMCHIWNLRDYTKKSAISAHWFTVNKIVIMPEMAAFVTASRDKTWRLWSRDTYQLMKSIDVQKGGHVNSVNTILWVPEFKSLISAGDDRQIRVFQIE